MSLFHVSVGAGSTMRPGTWGVFDLETDDLDDARIVQLGAVIGRGLESFATRTQLINPGRPISIGAQKIHGITDAMVADQPFFAEVAADWHQALCHGVELFLATFNGRRFDEKVLLKHFADAGVCGCFPRILDLFDFIKWRHRHVWGLTLAEVCERYGVHIEKAHDAGADASATASLLQLLVADGTIPNDLGEAMAQAAQFGPRLDWEYEQYKYFLYEREDGVLRIGFDKRRIGTPLTEIDRGFLRWILKKDDEPGRDEKRKMPPVVRELFKAAAAGRPIVAPTYTPPEGVPPIAASFASFRIGPIAPIARQHFTPSHLPQVPNTAAALRSFFSIKEHMSVCLVEVVRDVVGRGKLTILVPQGHEAPTLQALADNLARYLFDVTDGEWRIDNYGGRLDLLIEVQQYASGLPDNFSVEACIAGRPPPSISAVPQQSVSAAQRQWAVERARPQAKSEVGEGEAIVASEPHIDSADDAAQLFGKGSLLHIKAQGLEAAGELSPQARVQADDCVRVVLGVGDDPVLSADLSGRLEPRRVFGEVEILGGLDLETIDFPLPATALWLHESLAFHGIKAWKLVSLVRRADGTGRLCVELPNDGAARPSVYHLAHTLRDLVHWMLIYREDQTEWERQPDALVIEVRQRSNKPEGGYDSFVGGDPLPAMPAGAHEADFAASVAEAERQRDSTKPCFHCAHRVESRARVADCARINATAQIAISVADPVPRGECKFHGGYGLPEKSLENCDDFTSISEAWLVDTQKPIGWRRLLAGPGKLAMFMHAESEDDEVGRAQCWAKELEGVPGMSKVEVHRLMPPVSRTWNFGELPTLGSLIADPLRRYFWTDGRGRNGVTCELERLDDGTGCLYVVLTKDIDKGMLALIGDYLFDRVNRGTMPEFNKVFGQSPVRVSVEVKGQPFYAFVGLLGGFAEMRFNEDTGEVAIAKPAAGPAVRRGIVPREPKPGEKLEGVPLPEGVTESKPLIIAKCDVCGAASDQTALIGGKCISPSLTCRGAMREHIVPTEFDALLTFKVMRRPLPGDPNMTGAQLEGYVLADTGARACGIIAAARHLDTLRGLDAEELSLEATRTISVSAEVNNTLRNISLESLRSLRKQQGEGTGVLWSPRGVTPILQSDFPAHLRVDAPPAAICSSCGRSTWDTAMRDQPCGMEQPDKSKCSGLFIDRAAGNP